MIRALQINNYKSLHELKLDVGRFNVLIGENGCGKSNVLEAIALAAATAADKLDNGFLVSRGIRVTEPQLMRAAFSEENLRKHILLRVDYQNASGAHEYVISHNNEPYTKWTRSTNRLIEEIKEWIYKFNQEQKKEIEDILNKAKIADIDEEIVKITAEEAFNSRKKLAFNSFSWIFPNKEEFESFVIDSEIITNEEARLKNFLIYSPENTALRNFSKEGQIEPLGINGEGLLKLLKVIQSKSPEQLEEIVTCLELFDWFDNLHIPENFSSYEDKVTITDRFLSTAFDQRSANEGFLFVLFYIALMVSDDTPKIFAIDNIDVALNPKLCTKLIKELVRLAKKYDKQVFVTTHNPAILDGIDLGDDEQRLLVLKRNKEGHTRVKRIELKDKPRSSTDEELRLSEAFLRGYLGGLPKGF
ncbi:AAA family ATPase [Methylovulum miyakonense]|uniref:AAA family ATPase n=1 Tax=Methylovulum miyakonense TaxID=645578 RepID=UPI0003664005|nr:AAA family ATPase [Methylovulum miyakonense]